MSASATAASTRNALLVMPVASRYPDIGPEAGDRIVAGERELPPATRRLVTILHDSGRRARHPFVYPPVGNALEPTELIALECRPVELVVSDVRAQQRPVAPSSRVGSRR